MEKSLHRVVIVGGGFAGIEVAKALKGEDVEVTLVDRRNHHLFQPLLYQVATGGLSPADIATPIRGILSKQKNATVVLGEVTGFDIEQRLVLLGDGSLPYDTLVVAGGARHSYFGRDDWELAAPGLKTLEDATEIRRRVLSAFEQAERANSKEERDSLLTFIVVGGGPTGVELAGALGELARHTLRNDFRNFDSRDARILLVEAGPRILGTYTESLSKKAEKALGELGVSVHTGTLVTDIQPSGVVLRNDDSQETVTAATVIWSAGVAASPLGALLASATGAELDRVGRVNVQSDLTVQNHPELFIAGDLARVIQDGEPLRGTADIAQAEGKYIGKLIAKRLQGRDAKPFRFRDFGKLAVIGRSRAIADLKPIKFSGRLAWWFWLFMHVIRLVGYRNRATVLLQWAWSYFTRNKAARLITGAPGSPPAMLADNMPPKKRTTNGPLPADSLAKNRFPPSRLGTRAREVPTSSGQGAAGARRR